ncbi:MAG: ABC transporter substrate-binding protein [Actinomycetota bacterium]
MIVALASIAASCSPEVSEQVSQRSSGGDVPRGGVVRVLVVARPDPFVGLMAQGDLPEALDPHRDQTLTESWELLRCCLARTLLSHNGRSADEGGAVLHPDLARALPTISPDGRTWTFRLREGVTYGPPLEDVEITAQDFVRSFHRALAPSNAEKLGPFLFGDIVGAEEYTAGSARTISGLETPDPHTLVIQVTRPAGDLGARLALPIASPLPPHPDDPTARFGIAQGLAEYGPYLVSSGPYMLEGGDHVDYSLGGPEPEPARGFDPGNRMILVRNPAWDERSDPLVLRPAYADRIELMTAPSTEDAVAEISNGRADLALHLIPPPQFSDGQIRDAQAPGGATDVRLGDFDLVRGIVMNLAVKPFDDVHVRKALNLVVDKQRMLELSGGLSARSMATHMLPNSVIDNLLVDYDPYATPEGSGAVTTARAEMRASRYDEDGDGVCDSRVCARVRAVVRPGEERLGASVRSDLAEIGIDLDVEVVEDHLEAFFNPTNRTPMSIGAGWVKTQMSAASFFVEQFYSPFAITEEFANGSLVGATPEQLEGWGYDVTKVPNVDDRIDACLPLFGAAQFECWAELDQYLMQEVVPWVPYAYGSSTLIISSDLENFEYDQLFGMPAFDQIAVE